MKKIISALLILTVVLSTMSMVVFADETATTPTVAWTDKIMATLVEDGLAGNRFDTYNSYKNGLATYSSQMYLTGPTHPKGQMDNYSSFDISGLRGKNIIKVSFFVWIQTQYHANSTIDVYSFDTSNYVKNDVAPTLDKEILIDTYNVPDTKTTPLTSFTDDYALDTSNTATFNVEFDVTEYVMSAIEEGKISIGLAMTKPSGDSSATCGTKSMLSVQTSTNSRPTVAIDTAKSVDLGDTITLTANGTDADETDTLTYTFYDNEGTLIEKAEGQADNVRTFTPAEPGSYTFKVVCSDQWGAEYGGVTEATATVNVIGKTETVAATATRYNGYDGLKFDEWNYKVAPYNNAYNYVLSGQSDGKKSLYIKYNISSFVGKDIHSARIVANVSDYYSTNAVYRIYGLDNEMWNEKIAPNVNRSAVNLIAEKTMPATQPFDVFTVDGKNYDTELDVTDYIKESIAEGKNEICVVIDRNDTKNNTLDMNTTPPALQIVTTTNDVPTLDMDVTKTGLTFTGSDENGSDLTYTVSIDGGEPANATTVNFADLSKGTHYIKAKCTDEAGDYGVRTYKLVNPVSFDWITNEAYVSVIKDFTNSAALSSIDVNFKITDKSAGQTAKVAVVLYSSEDKVKKVKLVENASLDANGRVSASLANDGSFTIASGDYVKAFLLDASYNPYTLVIEKAL